MHDENRQTMFGLSQTEIHMTYRMRHCIYWEVDFVNRCIDRSSDEINICNLLYKTLSYGDTILDVAYKLYCEMQDCNVAYNDTLDAVIDKIERCIADGTMEHLGCHRPGYFEEGGNKIHGEEKGTGDTLADSQR